MIDHTGSIKLVLFGEQAEGFLGLSVHQARVVQVVLIPSQALEFQLLDELGKEELVRNKIWLRYRGEFSPDA